MREIKFRGLSMGDGKTWEKGMLFREGHELEYLVIQDSKGNESYVIPETVGQFTSLKDKKGKEIYDGDIAEIEFGKKAEIKYIKNAGGFFLEIHHKVSKEQIQLTKSWAEEIEIIGNKYEDGDMLEG